MTKTALRCTQPRELRQAITPTATSANSCPPKKKTTSSPCACADCEASTRNSPTAAGREESVRLWDELTKTSNAAVERPRDHASSAPRVHNDVTHMRRARDAV
jgi:hypothetical protein